LHIDQLPTIVINKDIGELNHTKKRYHKKLSVSKLASLICRRETLPQLQRTEF
ncbi:hypothetical protein T01_12329, partial [Trichinella spiralis]